MELPCTKLDLDAAYIDRVLVFSVILLQSPAKGA